MGELLSIGAGKPHIECPQREPTRAIYYGVFFRDRNGKPQAATDNVYAERKRAEMFIELRKAEDAQADYFVATVSVPVSAEEAGKCGGQLIATAINAREKRRE